MGSRTASRASCRQYLLLVTLAALAYALAGPAVDHHFAERLPSHGHLFLSQATSFHVHPVQQPHGHGEPAHEAEGDILFIPDGEGQPVPDGFAVWQWVTLAALLAILPALVTTFLGWPSIAAVRLPCPPPLYPPPRAALAC